MASSSIILSRVSTRGKLNARRSVRRGCVDRAKSHRGEQEREAKESRERARRRRTGLKKIKNEEKK